jgi:ketose-bisphosphate aldolase
MPLVSEKEVLDLAKGKDFAVPGFFAFNYEFIKIIIEVAEEERCPVVLCQGPEFIKKNGEAIFSAACKAAAMHAKVPVALAVDHSFVTNENSIPEQIHNIHLGWNSVMVDGSLLSYEENVKISKELADICKGAGVSSCAALGEVRRFFPQAMHYDGPFEESFIVPEEIKTDPKQAKDFVEKTGINTLAISIGQYVRSLWDGERPPFKKSARLDFDRLDAICEEVDVPLILHGATHVCEDDLALAAKKGVAMIKVASEQAIHWALELQDFVANHPECMFPEDIQKSALEAVKESMRHYVRLFNANNRV